MADNLNSEQQKVVDYFKSLNPFEAQEELSRIITMTDYGAKIQGKELDKVYAKLGIDGNPGINYELADQLTNIYKKVLKIVNVTKAEG